MWQARHRKVRCSKYGAWGLPLALAVLAGGCQDGYPIPATRCDRWCELTRETECGAYNPATCVSGCETAFGGEACYAEFDALLLCAERLPASERRCNYNNFGTVLECSAPKSDLDACARGTGLSE